MDSGSAKTGKSKFLELSGEYRRALSVGEASLPPGDRPLDGGFSPNPSLSTPTSLDNPPSPGFFSACCATSTGGAASVELVLGGGTGGNLGGSGNGGKVGSGFGSADLAGAPSGGVAGGGPEGTWVPPGVYLASGNPLDPTGELPTTSDHVT